MATDYYVLLGVNQNASEDEIKRAYRQLAAELHPDANGGDTNAEARFKEVTAAYETLRDPERRRRYDMFGPEGQRGGGTGPGDMFGGGIGDLFGAFFGNNGFGGQQQRGPRRGDDVEIAIDLRFEEAIFGIERAVTFRGIGHLRDLFRQWGQAGNQPKTCPECSGIGQVRRVRQSILGQVVTTTPCPNCHGLGEIIEAPCPDCRSEGRLTEERTVHVEVPPGVDDGMTLRITGGGGAALRGGVAGDLYVHLRIAAHEHFRRDGAELETTLHVSMAQGALGAAIEIETLDGTETITVPAGTQTGKSVRLKGLGVPHVRSKSRGDLHVHIVVDTPTNLSKEQAELLRELARLRDEDITEEEAGLFSRIRSSFA